MVPLLNKVAWKTLKKDLPVYSKMKGLSYLERLNRLGLYSLEFRRTRCALIEIHKILREHNKVDAKMFSLMGEFQNLRPII